MMTPEQIQTVLDQCADPKTVVRVTYLFEGETTKAERFGCSPRLIRGVEPTLNIDVDDHLISMVPIDLMESFEIISWGKISDFVSRAEQILSRKFNLELAANMSQLVGILNKFMMISKSGD